MDILEKKDLEGLGQERVDILNEILLNTKEQYQMIENILAEQIKKKDENIDLLHKELEYYKQEQGERLLDQVMKEIIKLRNGLMKTIQSDSWESLSEEELRKTIIYVEEDLIDLLQRQNIDPFSSLPGEEFDRSRHKVSKVVPTNDKTLDKKIQKSVSPGYLKKDKVMIPEQVVVYRITENEGEN